MSTKDAEAERKAKAARAKKLLAQRRKQAEKSATGTDPGSSRTSVSLDDSARGEVKEALKEGVEDKDIGSSFEVKESKTETQEDVKTDSRETAGKKDEEGPKETAKGEQDDPKQVLEESAADESNVAASTELTDPESTPSKAKKKKEKSDSVDTKATKATLAADNPSPAKPSPETNGEPVPNTEAFSNLQQTVSLLMAERTELQAKVASLKASLQAAKADSQLLAEGRALISKLEEKKKTLEASLDEVKKRADQVSGLEKELEKAKDASAEGEKERDALKKQVEEERRKGAKSQEDVQEQIQGLEKSLERAREKEGGLEAELGRLRQSITELQAKIDQSTTELETLRKSSTADSSTLTDLRKSHKDLEAEHEKVQSELEESKKAVAQHQETLSTQQKEYEQLTLNHDSVSSKHQSLEDELSKSRETLEQTNSKLEAAIKRADTAEKKRTALQEENGELVKQLEEVRGRVVQVMEEKMELAAQLGSWETKAKAWEKEKEEKLNEVKILREQAGLSEKLQKELDELRSTHSSSQADLEGVRKKLEALQAGEDEVSSLKAAHALELSQHTERIRSLEAELHGATSKVHYLSRQLADIQADAPASPRGGYFFADDGHRSSAAIQRPTGVDALLPANVRQKRQVSLSALKARMGGSYTLTPLSPLDGVHQEAEGGRRQSGSSASGTLSHGGSSAARKQFGDEIVFCCPACEGDLITL